MAETKKPKSKAELMAEKMRQKQVGKAAFEAGKKPIIEIDPPVNAPETPQEAPEVEEVSPDVQAPDLGKEAAELAAKEVRGEVLEASENNADREPVEEVAKKPSALSIDAIDEEIKKASKKKQVKVNTSFTLSPDVINEITRRSKRAGKTKASYLDDLLKRVFEL